MMKMNPRSAVLKENHTSGEIQSSSPSQLKNRSVNRKNKNLKENVTPYDANAIPDSNQSPCKPSPAAGKLKNPLPPRPPVSNPLKRKLFTDPVQEIGVTDSGVKVIVRVRPPNKEEEEGEVVVQKSADDSLSVLGHSFTFDSVADAESSQMDIFQLVGAPLVENCLAGFNSSVFAYGQTGSGKTYTIWGPTNALLEKDISSDQQGLTPRVFERLFSRIDEEQKKHADKQLIYQCRCSFLEIYNEQITDLLEPTQRNLQIREDVKTGVYVENLTEVCVNSMKDVMQLLLKGLAHRRIGATSINVESSRSHSVFTCVVESLYKRVADGLSCCKTSRINLVDLAGSERQKLTGAAGERLKEAGNINRSLSQLGNLINILAEVSQTGKQRHIPYRDSKLTFLLQESLGGNAKLAMVCAISPALSCKSETLSTLRFAQRAKAIKNKAVINEQMQDDVVVLREVIRQLRDELLLMKANGMQADPSGASSGWNARRSLNLLKFSLNRPMVLPRIDDDGDEEMEIVEEVDNEEKLMSQCVCTDDTDVNMEEDIVNHCTEEIGSKEESFNQSFDQTHSEDNSQKPSDEGLPSISNLLNREALKMAVNESLNCPSSGTENIGSGENPTPSLAIVPSDVSLTLKNPVPSVSPRANGNSRKSLRTSSMLTASQKDLTTSNLSSEDVHVSGARTSKGISLMSAQGKNRFGPTDQLAASLHRGLEIIDSHRQSSALRQSSFRFSYKPVDIKPVLVRKDVAVQTLFQDTALKVEESPVFLCSNCKNRTDQEVKVEDDSLNMQLVPVDGPHSADKSKKLVPRAVEKVLAGAIRREMALEEYCSRQAYEIMQLNRLVQQYKHERECSAIIGQTQEDKIICLESLMDGILSTEEFKDDELASMKNEHKILKEKYENHPELLRMEIELKRVQDELERYRNFFDMGEKDVLLEEIQDLKSQLQLYIDSSPKSSRKRSPMLQLTYSCNPTMAPPLLTIPESMKDSAEEKIEQERIRWTEAESKWISLAEELRSELEASRTLAEKQKLELDMEKKCSEELKEAMQMAMEGHARMLEQYADLEEKHIQLLARQRRIQDGVEDIKKAASRAGVRGAESKFINALAAEISTLKVEREKERRQFRDEKKGLQTQLRDTAEAVQAAGELLVRLKEAEEAVAASKKRAREAEQETEKAYKQIEKLKRKHENEITTFHQLLAEAQAQLPTETSHPAYDAPDVPKYDVEEPGSMSDQRWREEFEPFYNVPQEPSFFGYDRCNV